MRYIGGKARIAADLAPIILQTRPKIVTEPFCGALSVTVELLKRDKNLIVYASDAHQDLVNLWIAVQEGWDPPQYLSKEEYQELKQAEASPLRTFAGYGCSFSGKWFGGYAEDKSGRNYCGNARNSIGKKKPYLDRVVFRAGDYREAQIGDVIYCDPPYAGTTKPGERGEFNHQEFWSWVQAQSVPAYVSEYTAPDNFKSVWEKKVTLDMQSKLGNDARVEKLFTNRS